MTGRPAHPAFVIEQFDPQKHDRESFNSGIPTVDNYLKLTANKLVRAGNVRLFIATAPGGEIAGFYAVNAHSVELGDLPRRTAASPRRSCR